MGAMSLVGLVVFAMIGVAELWLIQTTIYPAMRQRYEAAKVTGASATNPNWVMNLFRFQCLVALPFIGLVYGKVIGY
jgi:hypothetical protein